MPLELLKVPFNLTSNLFFMGEVKRKFSFETTLPGPRRIVMPDGSLQEDCLVDDTFLAYRNREGLVIITGCAHAGICNTVDYAKKVCGKSLVLDIIGGAISGARGLSSREPSITQKGRISPRSTLATALPAKVAPARVTPLQETGVGLRLEYGDR